MGVAAHEILARHEAHRRAVENILNYAQNAAKYPKMCLNMANFQSKFRTGQWSVSCHDTLSDSAYDRPPEKCT